VGGAGANASRLLQRKFSTLPEALGIPADASGVYRPSPQATIKVVPRHPSLKSYTIS